MSRLSGLLLVTALLAVAPARADVVVGSPAGNVSVRVYVSSVSLKLVPSMNGKPALEWVMERQCVKTDKASGIMDDANLYAIETVGNPAYPLELFQRIITVSLETMKIVRGLPKLGELH